MLGVIVSYSNSLSSVSFCLREVGAGRWTEALEKGSFTMSLGHQRVMLSTVITSERGHLAGYKDHTTSIFVPFIKKDASYLACQFGAIRKSSWHILQSLSAWLSLGFGAVLPGATEWNRASAGTQGKITSLHLSQHIWRQTDVPDGDGQPNLQLLNLQRHHVLSLNIHLGPS